MSANGTKRTSRSLHRMSAFGAKRTLKLMGVMSAFDLKHPKSNFGSDHRHSRSAQVLMMVGSNTGGGTRTAV